MPDRRQIGDYPEIGMVFRYQHNCGSVWVIRIDECDALGGVNWSYSFTARTIEEAERKGWYENRTSDTRYQWEELIYGEEVALIKLLKDDRKIVWEV